jgi:hypothetical protein
VALAGTIEIGLRAGQRGAGWAALDAWTVAPPWEHLRTLAPDGTPEPRPNGTAAWALAPGEPTIMYRLDALGLREDRDPAPWPASGICRVLAIGDAYTFGYGVPADAAWPRQLERHVARVEVLNAGFPNLDVEQQRGRLATLLPLLHPQVVVATFDWWNVPLPPAPPPPARWSAAWWIANLDEKATRLGEHLAVVHELARLTRQAASPALVPPSGLARELEPLSAPPEATAARWARARAALIGMAGDVERAGARFVLVLTPLDLQLDPGRNALYRNGALPYPAHGFVDIDYRSARALPAALDRLALTTGIALLDLGPAFSAHGGSRLFLGRDYHAAPAGQRVIAREIARWLSASRACGARASVDEADNRPIASRSPDTAGMWPSTFRTHMQGPVDGAFWHVGCDQRPTTD